MKTLLDRNVFICDIRNFHYVHWAGTFGERRVMIAVLELIESCLDGRIPVVIGVDAKKSCLEHKPVRLSEIAAPIPQPG
jgi:hypothetical protein